MPSGEVAIYKAYSPVIGKNPLKAAEGIGKNPPIWALRPKRSAKTDGSWFYSVVADQETAARQSVALHLLIEGTPRQLQFI